MRISFQALHCPKYGSSESEYEDAYSPKKQGELEGDSFRFAVADGATESSFSRLWAQMLVRSYMRSPLTPTNLRRRVERRCSDWGRQVEVLPLPWFAEEKVRLGAFSTLLGLSLETQHVALQTEGQWTALAVGDTCLFQIRESELLTSFPIKCADEFGYHPSLVSSNRDRNQAIWEQQDRIERTGQWQACDTFFLMTDALACWFLSQFEKGEKPWMTLNTVAEQAQLLRGYFGNWTDEIRASRAMRNDDVTLLIVDVEGNYETATAG
jgi:hypothetical protein